MNNSTAINSSAIIQDTKGFIWLATPDGLVRDDGESITVFNNNNKNWPLPFNWINDISLLENNQLLLATETHGVWIFDTLTGSASKINIKLHSKSVKKAIKHNGFYYLHAPYKLYRVNAQTLEVHVISESVDVNALLHTAQHVYITTDKDVFKIIDKALIPLNLGVSSAAAAIENTLLVATKNKINKVHDSGLIQTTTVDYRVYALAHSNDRKSLFSANKHGEITQYSLNGLTKIAHGYSAIENSFVEKIFHDRTGVLWQLTNHGLVKSVNSEAKNHPRVFNVSINAIALTAHKNRLIIGSYGEGLHEFATNKLLPKNINDSLSKKAKIITSLHSIDDSIYITTFDGLWEYNSTSQVLKKIDFIGKDKILLNMSHKGNKLYIATNRSGVYIIDRKTHQLVKHIRGNRLSSSETISVLALNDNTLWVATSAGIDIVNLNTNTIRTINKQGENKVIALLAYKNKIYATTKGDGVFVYNKEGQPLAHIGKNFSFSNMIVANEKIWVSGKPGLYRITPENYQLKMVQNTGQYSFTRTPVLLNNSIYAGHYGGILEVPLEPVNTVHPSIHISKTTASGSTQLLNNKIDIRSANDVITLELASLDFRSGQKKQYKYNVNGGDWYEVNGSQLTFTGLSPGEYRIEIMGTNSLGQWSNYKAYADINVAYPWYWEPKIRILYAVIILATLILSAWLIYLRSRSISYIHQLLNDEIKTHGKSALVIRRKLNKALLILSQKPENNDSKPLDIQDKNLNINNLINECLDELSLQGSHVEPSSLSGSSLNVALPFLSNYFHEKYHILVTTTLDVDCEKIEYAIQSAIYRIIYEAISAAISNGNGGVFTISLNETNNKLWLKITDNEQSFAQFNNKIKFNMAMYYIRQVANKFNATFQTYDNQDKGSEIVISIPLMNIS